MTEKILVVDDDAFTRRGIEGYLQSLGHTVHTAADAQTGWELAVTQRPQTAVIDIRLPRDGRTQTAPVTEANGIGLSPRLKETFPILGSVPLSAHHEYEAEVIRLAQRMFQYNIPVWCPQLIVFRPIMYNIHIGIAKYVT